jgi:hypothetical protein
MLFEFLWFLFLNTDDIEETKILNDYWVCLCLGIFFKAANFDRDVFRDDLRIAAWELEGLENLKKD